MGCWATGGKWWGDDYSDKDSRATIEAAIEAGINFFDTAPLYGYGHADEVLTEALGSRRHDVIIATKVGVRFKGPSGHAQSDLSAAHIRQDTEASLKRLKLDQIPLLQIHWPCELTTPPQETMEALLHLQEEGKIAHIGACNYNADGLTGLLEHGLITTLQTPHSMVRSQYDQNLREICESGGAQQHPLGVIAYEPLCRGLLTGKYRIHPNFPPDDVRAQDDWFKGDRFSQVMGFLKIMDQVSEKVRVSLPTLAVAWSIRQPGVTTTIVGAKRPEQILETSRAHKLLDCPKLWSVLDRIVKEYPTI